MKFCFGICIPLITQFNNLNCVCVYIIPSFVKVILKPRSTCVRCFYFLPP
nr:MAG TPA: hypothetical protein [Caudoviricetes sp.]